MHDVSSSARAARSSKSTSHPRSGCITTQVHAQRSNLTSTVFIQQWKLQLLNCDDIVKFFYTATFIGELQLKISSIFHRQIHCVSKKQWLDVSFTSWADVDRFSNNVTGRLTREFSMNLLQRILPHLEYLEKFECNVQYYRRTFTRTITICFSKI